MNDVLTELSEMTGVSLEPEKPQQTQAQRLAKEYREAAKWLEQNPDVPVDEWEHPRITTYASWHTDPDTDEKGVLRRAAKAMGKGKKSYSDTQITLESELPHGGVYQIVASREKTCERVQVGTETVTIPAVEAREAQPERTEERPKFEWRCEPLLEPDAQGRT